ncbi:MAG: DUF3159 domain-containing protein [Candidatus Moduliflexus flocculans]|nr:DUF3159 domain-containing protein [Candidatus Moduliflexus flocculans]
MRSVLSGRGARLLDSFLPPVVFLILNSLAGVDAALWGALAVAALFAAYRIARKENLAYALGGLGGTLLAAVFVKLSGSGSGFFLPGFVSGAADRHPVRGERGVQPSARGMDQFHHPPLDARLVLAPESPARLQ